jgi:hypothetical protein
MTMTRTDPKSVTLAVDAKAMTIRSVIATIEPDRAGDIVVPLGLSNLDDYLLNPVVLWAHDRVRVPPVGQCDWLDPQPRRIVAQTRFAEGVRFAEEVFKLYEQRVLRGWSIGFLPLRGVPRAGGGMRFERWELLEYSAVPIPENPGALTVALEKGTVKDETLKAILARVPDDRGGKYHRTSDVLSGLVAKAELVFSD